MKVMWFPWKTRITIFNVGIIASIMITAGCWVLVAAGVQVQNRYLEKKEDGRIVT